VEPVLIVPWQDRFGHLAFDFDADLIGRHHVAAGKPVALGKRQHRRQCGRRRMREQAVHPILQDGELRIVVIVGVDRHTVGERREARRHRRAVAADDRASPAGPRQAERTKISMNDMAGFRRRAGERQPDAVEHRALPEMSDIGRNIFRLGVDDEIRDVGGQ
jgi:hypothetical protein